ncbi:MAG: TRAP transporter small permease [Hyphomicrobiaceae bacterium]
MKLIDRVSDGLAVLAAILMFLTGVFLTYEVAGRYLFRAPTSWAQEVSELFLLWSVFLALGAMIHHRRNISIDVLFQVLGTGGQRVLEIVALVFVLVFLVLTAQSGFEIAWASVARGTTTGTMVDIPSYFEEAAVPVGCAWAALQAVVELLRAVSGIGYRPNLGAGSEH